MANSPVIWLCALGVFAVMEPTLTTGSRAVVAGVLAYLGTGTTDISE